MTISAQLYHCPAQSTPLQHTKPQLASCANWHYACCCCSWQDVAAIRCWGHPDSACHELPSCCQSILSLHIRKDLNPDPSPGLPSPGLIPSSQHPRTTQNNTQSALRNNALNKFLLVGSLSTTMLLACVDANVVLPNLAPQPGPAGVAKVAGARPTAQQVVATLAKVLLPTDGAPT